MPRLLFLLQHAAIEIPKEWQACMDLCFFPLQLREKQPNKSCHAITIVSFFVYSIVSLFFNSSTVLHLVLKLINLFVYNIHCLKKRNILNQKYSILNL